ncbi:hypothetical protein [Marinospirillum minutulum]|uniref:hypothetical protein n=1 Tax=Marinospirillum minutulum TaxID=64974 RepID=UPI00040C03A4|nr:hypothetical protein [Marinospirillum minutulum]
MRIQLTALVLAILLPLGAVQAAEGMNEPEQRLNLTQEQREQMQVLREQMREKNRAQMRALLTPEQQVTFDKMSAQQLERQEQGKGWKDDKGWKGKHHERRGDKQFRRNQGECDSNKMN